MEKTLVHGLPRTCRIRRRPDFTLCYETGRRHFSQSFVIFTCERAQGGWRVGFAVSKKMGNAVRRNRIKRVLREFYRLHSHLLPSGVDLVTVPKKTLLGVDVNLALITTELAPLLRRIAKAYSPRGGQA